MKNKSVFTLFSHYCCSWAGIQFWISGIGNSLWKIPLAASPHLFLPGKRSRARKVSKRRGWKIPNLHPGSSQQFQDGIFPFHSPCLSSSWRIWDRRGSRIALRSSGLPSKEEFEARFEMWALGIRGIPAPPRAKLLFPHTPVGQGGETGGVMSWELQKK